MQMDNDYKSPTHKLVKFFERSRNQWKKKPWKLKKDGKSGCNLSVNMPGKRRKVNKVD